MITGIGFDGPCFERYKTEFLPLLESSGYVPHVPLPTNYQVLLYLFNFIDILAANPHF